MSRSAYSFFLVVAFMYLTCIPAHADTRNFARTPEPSIAIASPRDFIEVGEQFLYSVRWMGIPVGHASLMVKEETEIDGHPVYHVVATARSNDFLSTFYPLEDVVHSYIDKTGFFSRRFLKHQREGRYRSDEEMLFDHEEGKARYHSLLNGSTKWLTIPRGVHDPVSAFYAFRLMSVGTGETIRMDVNSDEKNWVAELVMGPTRRMEFKDVGTFDCLEVEPVSRLKGLLVRRGRVWVYFTADARRVPVFFKIRTPWGVVTGTIKREAGFADLSGETA